ncbi:MAG TPA: TetR/AcrR family transcriptional regulator [Pyrinomonadaceae bacterium]|nr:TetR/AcrR family transcriptional regulator [Pyrinomonadaceae bacterium]
MSKQILSTNDGVSGARMAGEERRLQILAVAVSLFSNRGFRGTTTKEIAQAAGVSEAMVFRHFATKEELYAAILDHKACAGHESFAPEKMAAEAIKRKDDRAVFEALALGALDHHENDREFQRLLLHSALEKHELAQMFFDQFVRRVYEFLGAYIRERQRDGAFVDVDPAIVVRCFIGMVMHHSLNNNLWDPNRRLLNISNKDAARHFTDILLNGITAPEEKAKKSAGSKND